VTVGGGVTYTSAHAIQPFPNSSWDSVNQNSADEAQTIAHTMEQCVLMWSRTHGWKIAFRERTVRKHCTCSVAAHTPLTGSSFSCMLYELFLLTLTVHESDTVRLLFLDKGSHSLLR